jgi:hypothetical protein
MLSAIEMGGKKRPEKTSAAKTQLVVLIFWDIIQTF